MSHGQACSMYPKDFSKESCFFFFGMCILSVSLPSKEMLLKACSDTGTHWEKKSGHLILMSLEHEENKLYFSIMGSMVFIGG